MIYLGEKYCESSNIKKGMGWDGHVASDWGAGNIYRILWNPPGDVHMEDWTRDRSNTELK
jgi:hypothetical protein